MSVVIACLAKFVLRATPLLNNRKNKLMPAPRIVQLLLRPLVDMCFPVKPETKQPTVTAGELAKIAVVEEIQRNVRRGSVPDYWSR